MEKHSVSKLIGSLRDTLATRKAASSLKKLRRNPYSVILFDEIEKAHPDVF